MLSLESTLTQFLPILKLPMLPTLVNKWVLKFSPNPPILGLNGNGVNKLTPACQNIQKTKHFLDLPKQLIVPNFKKSCRYFQ